MRHHRTRTVNGIVDVVFIRVDMYSFAGEVLNMRSQGGLFGVARIGTEKACPVVSMLAMRTLQPLRMEMLHEPRHTHVFI
jgi:hypothetical protein